MSEAADEHLAACWNFDEGQGDLAHDASPGNNHGRISGRYRWVAEAERSALFFNGWNTLVNCGNDATLGPQETIMLEVWLKPNAYGQANYILYKHDAYALYFSDYGRLTFSFWDSKHQPYFVQTAEPLLLNTWHHVIAAFDGFSIRLYVNGRRVAEGSYAYNERHAQLATSSEDLIIGGLQSSRTTLPCFFFCGEIERISISSKTLDAETARARYQADRRSRTKPLQLVRPQIEKQGTILAGICESTPFVFQDRLYLMYGIRDSRNMPEARLVIRDVESGQEYPPFGKGCAMCCAYAEGDTAYVYAHPGWSAPEIVVFWSQDLVDWQTKTAISLPGWQIFNPSMTKTDDGYVMAIDVGDTPENQPHEIGHHRFIRSQNLFDWELTPPECNYTTDYYAAAVALRYTNGHFYSIHLRSLSDMREFHTHISRSRDLIHWEDSPINPFLVPSDADRLLVTDTFTAQEKKQMEDAINHNASDLDLCEFEGKTYIYYCWGDQRTHGPAYIFLAYAVYDGPLPELLESYFGT